MSSQGVCAKIHPQRCLTIRYIYITHHHTYCIYIYDMIYSHIYIYTYYINMYIYVYI